MKWLLLVLALVACEKPDAAGAYRDQAVALESYYRPVLDRFATRMDRIRERGQVLRGAIPGADDVGNQLKAALQKLGELRALVAPGPGGKSALDLRIADTSEADALARLVGETRSRLVAGVEVIDDKLDAVEDWLAAAEVEIRLHPPPTDQATAP